MACSTKQHPGVFKYRPPAARRFLYLIAVLFILSQTVPCRAFEGEVKSPTPPARGKHAIQLAAECDALMESAIKTSYGWGWGETSVIDVPAAGAADPKTSKARPRPRIAKKPRPIVKGGEIDVRATAAAGLLLHLAGEQLEEPNVTVAANEAARALAAVQHASGQFPAIGVLGAQPNGKVETALIPARSSTCASLGLLLTVLQSSEKPDERITRAAVKSSHWLIAQQTDAGSWLTIHPPGAEAKAAKRLIRLDNADTRDDIAAMLLAAQVLNDATVRHRAKLAVKELLALRLPKNNEAGHDLWATAYLGSGDVAGNIPQLPPAVDALASKYALQAIFTDTILDVGSDAPKDGPKSSVALLESSKALAALPRMGGATPRLFDFDPAKGPIKRPPEPKTPDNTSEVFGEATPENGPEIDLVAGIPPLLAACTALGSDDAAKYRDRMDDAFLVQHRVALLLSGLSDDALTLEFPTARGRVESFLQTNKPLWSIIEGPLPRDLTSRLERLRSLIFRVTVERL